LSPRFDVERFAELRRSRPGLSWGEPLTYGEETGSTNDDALAAARQGAPSGSVFLAERQTRGRGRRGRSWLAESGQSLLFSVLLRPAASSEPGAQTGALTLAVGLGVRAALAPFSEQPLSVKWPNDVLCGPRKLAGILCESQLHGGRALAVVIGIGINVGRQSFPPELQNDVTCLEELSGRGHARERLLADVLAEVEQRVAGGARAELHDLIDEFRAYDALQGRKVFVSGARELSGIARGVDDQGHLLLETDGVVLAVNSGTVRLA
jgi:BirA family transcriptional regulator, biotin operon repressor / biotin---[acetyl-CoA-carboxylase] ligase